MALLDRFRTQSRQHHTDPAVRLAFVQEIPISEREVLAEIAREDQDVRVRRAAVAKVMDPTVLAVVARDDNDEDVRTDALAMLRDLALDAFEGVTEEESLAAVDVLGDTKTLGAIAKTALRERIAARALARIMDPRALGSIARHAPLEPIRLAALEAVNDWAEILAVALNSEFKDSAVAAVERLTAREELEQTVARSKNKGAVKRARMILREMDGRAAADAAAEAPEADAEALPADSTLGLRVIDAALDPQVDPVVAGSSTFLEPSDELAAERERAAAEALRQSEEQRAADRQREEEAEARTRLEVAERDAERRRARMAELVPEAETAAADQDLSSAKHRFSVIKREWRDLVSGFSGEAELTARYEDALSRLASREREAEERDGLARREALAGIHQLLARVEPLASLADLSLKVADRALRDVRSALGHMPSLPSKQDYDEVAHRFKAVQAALTPKVQELRTAAEWQRWANASVQEKLCERMEALRTLEGPEEIVSQVRELQQQWRRSADVPRAQSEVLWRRFKAAHDEVWARCEAHFAAEAQGRAENLAVKTALCDRAEALAESTSWIQTAEEIKKLQAEWKTVGPVTRGQEKAVWERFRAACDRFFTRRHTDLAERKKVWAENLARKDELCAKVEQLAESTDWDAASAEVRRLQAEWKTIGPVKKTRSEAVWQRFRTACDRFFARYAGRHDVARAERVSACEAICAELEALGNPPAELAEGEAPQDLLPKMRTLRGRWHQEISARGIDRDRGAALDGRFQAAFARAIAAWPVVFAGTDLDPDANRKRMETLVRRAEELAASLGPGGGAVVADASLSPTTRLAAMLKEALAANTIGGKVDDSSRVRAAADELRQVQLNWSKKSVR